MPRLNNVVFSVLLTALLPVASYADKVEILGGNFVFLHDPAVPDGICDDPPGLHFSVTSKRFDGYLETTTSVIVIDEGEGDASGCVFDTPIINVVGAFAGSFTWHIGADELRGTFQLVDFLPETLTPPTFPVVIFIQFDGGTGKFNKARGGAFATGFDYPFGGAPLPPFFPAGVQADIVTGVLKLKE